MEKPFQLRLEETKKDIINKINEQFKPIEDKYKNRQDNER